MRTFVLGSTGYVGRGVVAWCQARREAEAIAVRGINELLADHAVDAEDVIINCVGYYGADAARLRDSNVAHTRLLADAVAERGCRVVHVSSAAVFDGIHEGRISETTPLRTTTAYGRTKREGEEVLLDRVPEASILRPTGVFGADDPRGRLRSLIAHVAAGRPLPVPEAPPLFANFIWSRELARIAVAHAGDRSAHGVYHVATPVPWTEFVTLLETATGHRVSRLGPVAARAAGIGASVAARLPDKVRPRAADRLLELWDRRHVVSDRLDLDPATVLAGLEELVTTTGPST